MLDFEYATKIEIQVDTIARNTGRALLHGITKTGQFTYRVDTTAGGGLNTQIFQIGEIPIYLSLDDSVQVYQPGDLYTVVSLLINGTKVYQYGAGYVSIRKSVSWPPSQNETAQFLKGDHVTRSSSDPAAGSEIVYTVSDGELLRIRAVRFTLVAAAAAASRRVHLVFTFNTTPVYDIIANTDQIISETKIYSGVAGGGGSASTNDNDIYIPLPTEIVMGATDTIETSTFNLQAGDNYSSMLILAEMLRNPIV
jgi:hypothetical protein